MSCLKWIEFVVGSCPGAEGFFQGSSVLLPPRKSTFLKSNSIGNSKAMGERQLNKVYLLYFVHLFISTLIETLQSRVQRTHHYL